MKKPGQGVYESENQGGNMLVTEVGNRKAGNGQMIRRGDSYTMVISCFLVQYLYGFFVKGF